MPISTSLSVKEVSLARSAIIKGAPDLTSSNLEFV